MNLNTNADFTLTGMDNSGTMNVNSNKFEGPSGDPCNFNNSGNINSDGGGISVVNISIFSNTGTLNVTNFNASDVQTFLNHEAGQIDALFDINIDASTFGNTGSLSSNGSTFIQSDRLRDKVLRNS